MIFGGFIIDPKGEMRLDARAVNVETSEIEHVETVTDKADNMLAVLSTLADKLNKGMKLPPMPGGVGAARGQSRGDEAGPVARSDSLRARRGRQRQEGATQALALYKDFLDKTPTTVLASQRRRAEQKVRELASGS